MRYQSIENVYAGDRLAMSIFNDDGTLLLTANTVIKPNHINIIKQLGFEGLYIFESSEKEGQNYDDLLSDDIRQKTIVNLKHINIDECLYIANKITNMLLDKPEVNHELITISSYDTKTYMHCLNVAVLSTMMGIDLCLDNKTLHELSQAALLHDIGKACIDINIINKPGKLTNEEYKKVQNHSIYGYNILRHNEAISESTCLGVLYHHENEDGTGYPKQLKSEDIPLFSKIIHAADVYDAMASKRSYKDAMNPADVFEYMIAHTDMFDINIIEALTNCVALYPIGSKIKLSDGRFGVVYKNTPGFPHRPIIRCDNKTIDLMKVLNVTIVNIIK